MIDGQLDIHECIRLAETSDGVEIAILAATQDPVSGCVATCECIADCEIAGVCLLEMDASVGFTE